MATYAKIPEGTRVPAYLTAGKEYLTRPLEPHESPILGFTSPRLFVAYSDRGQMMVCRWSACAQLYGSSWERIEREEEGESV